MIVMIDWHFNFLYLWEMESLNIFVENRLIVGYGTITF